MKISSVTFDVGGTLIRPRPSVGHVYSEVAARHGVIVPPAALNRAFASAWGELKDFHHAREEWSALVEQTFARAGAPCPTEPFFSELYDRFSDPGAWQVFDDVRPALDALAAQGINLGIISNWDDRLGPLLERLDLTKYFEAIVISCDVGFVKPSPVIFEHAARLLGDPPEAILHIGDCPERDMHGGRAAGFQAVLLDREGVREKGAIKSLIEAAALSSAPKTGGVA